MAIDVEWQDERGVRLARYIGPAIDSRLADAAPEQSCCLRFLNPWGDATFNERQVEVLEEELTKVVKESNDSQVVQQAERLLDFVRQIEDRTHRYLKFIGD